MNTYRNTYTRPGIVDTEAAAREGQRVEQYGPFGGPPESSDAQFFRQFLDALQTGGDQGASLRAYGSNTAEQQEAQRRINQYNLETTRNMGNVGISRPSRNDYLLAQGRNPDEYYQMLEDSLNE